MTLNRMERFLNRRNRGSSTLTLRGASGEPGLRLVASYCRIAAVSVLVCLVFLLRLASLELADLELTDLSASASCVLGKVRPWSVFLAAVSFLFRGGSRSQN